MNYLPSADQKIPDWLVITFLGEVKAAVRSGTMSQFGDVGLAQMTPFTVVLIRFLKNFASCCYRMALKAETSGSSLLQTSR